MRSIYEDTHPPIYNAKNGNEITVEKFKSFKGGEGDIYSRRPLSIKHILALFDTTVNLQE